MPISTDPRASGNQGAVRLTVDQDLISMEFEGRPPFQLRWDDPKLEFAVVDVRGAATGSFGYRFAYPTGTPTSFSLILGAVDTLVRSLSCPRAIWIPPAAFESLKTAAFGLGLHLYNGTTQHNAPSGGIVWDFRRKKILLEKELSPSTIP